MRVRTYDILNAGPRNRFTANGCIVSNSGRGVQTQNLPRGEFKDVDACLEAFATGGADLVDMIWGDPMTAASTCVRGVLTAAPGHDLIVADYSSIEARVLAWIAGEEGTLQAFRDGLDLYKVAASGIFNVAYEDVDKPKRQVGKTSILALGYQGGIGAYAAMAKNYGIDLETLPAFILPTASEENLNKAKTTAETFLKKNPGSMSLEAAMACDIIKQLWRAANPNIVSFWHCVEEMVSSAVVEEGLLFSYRAVAAKIIGDFLLIRLPSGRKLHYYAPKFETRMTPWGQEKIVVTYKSVNSMSNKFERTHLYGGLITENIVQAVARDLLVDAMLRAEPAGYKTVMHVHDEIVAEVPEGFGSVEEFEALMIAAPAWANGCPMGAEGYRAKRYRK